MTMKRDGLVLASVASVGRSLVATRPFRTGEVVLLDDEPLLRWPDVSSSSSPPKRTSSASPIRTRNEEDETAPSREVTGADRCASSSCSSPAALLDGVDLCGVPVFLAAPVLFWRCSGMPLRALREVCRMHAPDLPIGAAAANLYTFAVKLCAADRALTDAITNADIRVLGGDSPSFDSPDTTTVSAVEPSTSETNSAHTEGDASPIVNVADNINKPTPVAVVVHFMMAAKVNSHRGPGGHWCLFAWASKLAHSCDPNTFYVPMTTSTTSAPSSKMDLPKDSGDETPSESTVQGSKLTAGGSEKGRNNGEQASPSSSPPSPSSSSSSSSVTVKFVALRPIEQGEVISFSYGGGPFLALPVEQRQERLVKSHMFVCQCSKCSGVGAARPLLVERHTCTSIDAPHHEPLSGATERPEAGSNNINTSGMPRLEKECAPPQCDSDCIALRRGSPRTLLDTDCGPRETAWRCRRCRRFLPEDSPAVTAAFAAEAKVLALLSQVNTSKYSASLLQGVATAAAATLSPGHYGVVEVTKHSAAFFRLMLGGGVKAAAPFAIAATLAHIEALDQTLAVPSDASVDYDQCRDVTRRSSPATSHVGEISGKDLTGTDSQSNEHAVTFPHMLAVHACLAFVLAFVKAPTAALLTPTRRMAAHIIPPLVAMADGTVAQRTQILALSKIAVGDAGGSDTASLIRVALDGAAKEGSPVVAAALAATTPAEALVELWAQWAAVMKA